MSIGCLSGLMAWLLLEAVDAADKHPCAATGGERSDLQSKRSQNRGEVDYDAKRLK